VYVPSSPTAPAELGSFKIIQRLLPPVTAKREVQTLGSALNYILPSLFPSRRDAILAEPILHGAPVPFEAPLEELMKEAAYADDWIHLSVSMTDG
jgi:autophagy-related protein 5